MRELREKNFALALISHGELILKMCRREISGRYRGSLLGWLWSLLNPLLMLGVYTFVFSKVFKATWGEGSQGSETLFALNLFAGLIVFNMFGECAIRGPHLITTQSNYVKKLVFPLEILAPVATAAALFHALTSLSVLLVVQMISGLGVKSTVFLLPIAWLPLILGCLAVTWTFSALGVYMRDIGQISGVAVNVLMFMSAVFYPLNALPERIRPLLGANPLVHIIEQTRNICIKGDPPDIHYLLIGVSVGLIAAEFSFRLFQRARRGFADVL